MEHEPVGVVGHGAAAQDLDRLGLVPRDRAVGRVVRALALGDVTGGYGGVGAEQAAVGGGASRAVGLVQPRVDTAQLPLPVGFVELPPAAAEFQQHLGRAVVVEFADGAAFAVRQGRVDLDVPQPGERYGHHRGVRGELLAHDRAAAPFGHGVHPHVGFLAADVFGAGSGAVGVVVLDAGHPAVEAHLFTHAFQKGVRQYGGAPFQLVEGGVGADERGADEAVDEGQGQTRSEVLEGSDQVDGPLVEVRVLGEEPEHRPVTEPLHHPGPALQPLRQRFVDALAVAADATELVAHGIQHTAQDDRGGGVPEGTGHAEGLVDAPG